MSTENANICPDDDIIIDVPLETTERVVVVDPVIAKGLADCETKRKAKADAREAQKQKDFKYSWELLLRFLFIVAVCLIGSIVIKIACDDKIVVGLAIAGIIIFTVSTGISCVCLTLLCCCSEYGIGARIINTLK